MSLSNRIENTMISVVTAIVTITATVLIINLTAIKPMERQLEKQNALIKELAELEKYQIQNNFDKLKSHKGQIVLDLENDLNVTNISPPDSMQNVSERKNEPRRFFKRMFGKKATNPFH
jgi:hypothetical protein